VSLLVDNSVEGRVVRERTQQTGGKHSQSMGKLGLPLRVAACFFAVASATMFIGLAPEANLIWVANGLILAYLLLAPRRRWPLYLCAGFLAQCAGAMLIDPRPRMNFLIVGLNMLEVLIGALLLRRRSRELPQFSDRGYVLRFVAYAVVAGPLAAGLIYAFTLGFLRNADVPATLARWFTMDSLGTAVATPAYLALFQSRGDNTESGKRQWLYLALPVAASLVLFSQGRAPLVFLLYPILLIVMMRMGLGWAALSTLFVAGAGTWFTLHGEGAFAEFKTIAPLEPALMLQAFIAGAMLMLYSASVALGRQTSVQRQLEKIASLYSLVTENSRDAILIADIEGRPTFVSPAMQGMTGWTGEEMIGFGAQGLVHLDDRAHMARFVAELRAGTGSGMTEYRLRQRSGLSIWVEASLRVFGDPATSAPAGTMSIVRDISDRKRAEQEMQKAFHAAEALAGVDSLTGLANRRRFDEVLDTEWRRAFRDAKPLSLLLLDADYFKSYNDTYGHVSGDHCLRQIAEVARDSVSRPGDLVARYGGEEFAILLPATDNLGANEIGHEICEAMRRRNLPHRMNPHQLVTVSIGVSTLTPSFGEPMDSLVERADEALYRAKRTGRNRVCVAPQVNEAAGKTASISGSSARKKA
jgi:diguanylate cyclase (GGDEF)-like protein/PAS domain S-box-containing protein